jgi:DNA-binding HxlR family transcriptional regulator
MNMPIRKGRVIIMAEIKKLTKKDYFKELKEIVTEIGRTDLVDFIDHEVELLSKKSSKVAPTKTQVENEKIKSVIVDTLKALDRPVVITELQSANEELATYSNQKISALLTQLVNANIVTREVDKKKAYFSIASA